MTSVAPTDSPRNYLSLLVRGVSSGAANELTSVQLVLPVLYIPIFFAGREPCGRALHTQNEAPRPKDAKP